MPSAMKSNLTIPSICFNSISLRYGASHVALSNWRQEDFSLLSAGDEAFEIPTKEKQGMKVAGVDVKKIISSDKMALQVFL